MKISYKHTIFACFVGYIVQAIVNNFLPLLFVMFQENYNIPLSQITLLITFNFLFQLCVDFLSSFFIEKIGYKIPVILAHFLAFFGLVSLTFLPDLFQNHFTGLFISLFIYALGGGLIEVAVSPIVEGCPSDNKEGAMSLLHSFYCWGHVGVVLLSTIFFLIFGIQNWKILTLIWSIVPLLNGFLFIKVPVLSIIPADKKEMSVLQIFKTPIFYIFVLMMICSGASEQAVSQWASAFAEKGLGVNKTLGDLLGPLSFAALMGTSRLLYSKLSEKVDLKKSMFFSSILCVASYLLIVFSPFPILSLIGCAITGFSVGILWPGSFSIAAKKMPLGGGALFALLALAGDIGCSAGPTVAGKLASLFGDNLKLGILFAIVFPILMAVSILLLKFTKHTQD